MDYAVILSMMCACESIGNRYQNATCPAQSTYMESVPDSVYELQRHRDVEEYQVGRLELRARAIAQVQRLGARPWHRRPIFQETLYAHKKNERGQSRNR